MMRSNLKNKGKLPITLAPKKSEKNLKSSWDFKQPKPEKRISFNLIENLNINIHEKDLGKEKSHSSEHNTVRKANQHSLSNRNHRKESNSQIKALFLSDLSRKHYNNDVEEAFFSVNKNNKGNNCEINRATTVNNNYRPNKKSLTDFEIKFPQLSRSGLVEIPVYKTFQFGSKYQIIKNYYNLNKEKEKEIQRLPTNKTFMSNSSKKAEAKKIVEKNEKTDNKVKRPSYFNYYNNALIESERFNKESKSKGKNLEIKEVKEVMSSNTRSGNYNLISNDDLAKEGNLAKCKNKLHVEFVEVEDPNLSNDTIKYVKNIGDIQLYNVEKMSSSKKSSLKNSKKNSYREVHNKKRTLSDEKKRNAASITSKESDDVLSNYSSQENIYNKSISSRSYRKKSGKSIKFNFQRSSILSSKSRINTHLSLNQKRRQTYLNYRTSINNTTNSKRQSIFEFRYFQKAIEESSSNSAYESSTKYFKIVEIALGIIALINIFCAILDTQLYISRKDDLVSRTSNMIIFLARIEMETLSAMENLLRFIMIFTSITLVALIYFRYKLLLSLRVIDQQLSRFDNLYTSGDLKWVIIECLISGICYPPFVDVIFVGKVNEYDYIVIVNSIITMLTIIKIYHILRTYKYMSKYKNLQAVSICNKHGVKNDLLFAFKAEIKSRPFIALTLFIVFFICLSSFCLRTFENGVVISTDYLIENEYKIPYMNRNKLVELRTNITKEIADEQLDLQNDVKQALRELSNSDFKNSLKINSFNIRYLKDTTQNNEDTDEDLISFDNSNKTAQLLYIDSLLDYNNEEKIPLINNVSIAQIIRKGTHNLSYLFNSMWFIVESITTVAYGELFPKTHLGRAVSAVSCLLGIFLLSLVTASFSAYTEFTSEERKAYIIIKQLRFENNLKIKAWLVVKSILEINKMKGEKMKKLENKNSILTEKFNKISKLNYGKFEKHHKNQSHIDTKTKSLKDIKGKSSKDEKSLRISSLANQFLLFTQLKKDLSNFKNETKLTNKVVPIDEMFAKMRKKLSSDLYKLEFNVSQLKILEPSFLDLKNGTVQNEKKIDEIINLQEKIMTYILIHNNATFQSNIKIRNKFLTSQKSSTMLHQYATDAKPESTKSNIKISNSVKENSEKSGNSSKKSAKSNQSNHSNNSSCKDIVLKTKNTNSQSLSPKKNSKSENPISPKKINNIKSIITEELFNTRLNQIKIPKGNLYITPVNKCSANYRSTNGFPENINATGSFYKHRQKNQPAENENDIAKEKGFNSSYFRTDQYETDPNNLIEEDKVNARRIVKNNTNNNKKIVLNNNSFKALQPQQSNSCNGKLKQIKKQ